MTKRSGTVYWMDVSDLLAITLKKNWKIKVAKWGTPKKKKKNHPQNPFPKNNLTFQNHICELLPNFTLK
jgi:hypothetical protein